GLHGMGFTGRGVGTGSLNAYRQVQLDGAQLFEKVYLNSHWELAHMQYAQSHLLPRLGSLRSPTLVHLVPGQRLSVAYFEWADIPARQQRTLRSAANLVQQLQTIDPATLPRPPSTMTDFGVGQLDALMETTPSLLAAMFPGHNPPLDQALPLWRERIAALPRGFSHGDPSIGNVLPNGWVLDWDNCGLFPLGHDAAHYLALRHRQASWDRICQLFNAHFKDPRAPEASWHGFLFFYIPFLNKMPRRHESLFPAAVAALTKAMARG
ncbi:phosphotransferase, partial [Limnospira sp. PMC 1280.21]|uniref:phosphotransferase n=4 Tax=unclassified Limnospira TaxID=2642885 RepID=UPI0028E15C72